MSSKALSVSQVAFEDDGTIIVAWADAAEQSDLIGSAVQTFVSEDGQESDPHVAYWGNELRQAALEFLHAVLRAKK